eukprot:g5065.t1
MHSAGLHPNADSYSLLLKRLRIEGRDDEAVEIFEMTKSDLKLICDENILNTPSSTLSNERRLLLEALIDNNDDNDTLQYKGRRCEETAWDLLDKLIINECVDISHFSTMLSVCHSTDHMLELINEIMPSTGLKMDASCCHKVALMYRIEGDEENARDWLEKVVELSCQNNELSNFNSVSAAALTNKDLNLLRVEKLSRWISEGTDQSNAAAWKLLDNLACRGLADEFQFSAILKHSHSASFAKRIVQETMIEAGVQPSAPSYSILLSRFRMEGNDEVVRQLMSDMRKENEELLSNRFVRNVLTLSDESLQRMATMRVVDWCNRHLSESTRAAVHFVRELCKNNVATIPHIVTVLDHLTLPLHKAWIDDFGDCRAVLLYRTALGADVDLSNTESFQNSHPNIETSTKINCKKSQKKRWKNNVGIKFDNDDQFTETETGDVRPWLFHSHSLSLCINLKGASRGVSLAKVADVLLQLCNHHNSVEQLKIDEVKFRLSNFYEGGKVQEIAVTSFLSMMTHSENFVNDDKGYGNYGTKLTKEIVIDKTELKKWCGSEEAKRWLTNYNWSEASSAVQQEDENNVLFN